MWNVRTAFIEELIRQARGNPRIFLVVGDLGYSVVEPFAKEFPDRFLNAGVAEQNMTGVAAGLASEGYHVFTYSIANFPVLRCLEQIRNNVCYHDLPVTVVAVGAGLAYGNLGYSHHAVQDLAVMRSLPGLSIMSPADPGEARECLQWLVNHPRPSYLRLGKAGEKTLHAVRGIERGPMRIRAGRSTAAVVATGSILAVALAAAEHLERCHSLVVSVYSCPWLAGQPTGFFDPLWQHDVLVAIEEHASAGGFGEMLASLHPPQLKFASVALPEETGVGVGSQNYLRQRGGLTADRVAAQVLMLAK